MKSYPVVRMVSRFAAGVCLVACSSSNGTLFEDMEGESPSAEAEPMGEPTPMPQPDTPQVTDEPGEEPDSEQPNDDDLPLTGNNPVAPVTEPPVTEPPVAEPPEVTEEEPPAPEPEGPVIVSVSPADGAVGVGNGENIVIEFSLPMDREATEAAYQSESIPSGSVSFSWNDAGTQLTIVPDAPLAYSAGDDPVRVQARRVSFFISASATDLEGRSLPAPFESSFSLLRQIEVTLFALQDRALSGSFRSNDTYGSGQCARAEANMCVGDVRVNGNNEQSRGFISFELLELPEAAQSVNAELTLEITAMSGNPFGGLGGLVLEHASFDQIGSEAFSAQALDVMGVVANAGGTGTLLSADVASAFMADRAERAMTQYRLRFQDATDGDNNSDAIVSALDTQRLDVSYLVP